MNGTTLQQASASIQLQCLRLREFIRIYGEHDRFGRATSALARLEELSAEMSQVGKETARLPFGANQPGVLLGPGGDFTHSYELRQATGSES